jgi:hypothetical protein
MEGRKEGKKKGRKEVWLLKEKAHELNHEAILIDMLGTVSTEKLRHEGSWLIWGVASVTEMFNCRKGLVKDYVAMKTSGTE